MKKLAAIFLLGVFLFNIIGYRVLFFYAQQQSDIRLEASLDENHYNDSELVEIRLPIDLPYQSDWSKFERVDGEITVDGRIYKYVKRKVADGSLVLLCLPHYTRMRLNKEKGDFFKDVNNLAHNTGSKKQENSKANSFKNILSEFGQSNYRTQTALFEERISTRFSDTDVSLSTAPQASTEHPPEIV